MYTTEKHEEITNHVVFFAKWNHAIIFQSIRFKSAMTKDDSGKNSRKHSLTNFASIFLQKIQLTVVVVFSRLLLASSRYSGFSSPVTQEHALRIFLFSGGRLRANTRLIGNGERLGIFRGFRPHLHERENTRELFFPDNISRHGKRLDDDIDRRSSLSASTRRRFRAFVIIKCPRDDLSRSDVMIYESLRAEVRWNYRDVPWWMRLSLDVAREPVSSSE